MCLNDEPNWKKKPLFQLRSMAQTRASSRVYASVFRFVTVLADNVAGTPAEELDGLDRTPPPLPRTPDKVGHAAPPVDRAARLPPGVCLVTRVVQTPTKNPKVTRYVLTVTGNSQWPADMTSITTINDKWAQLAELACDRKRPVKLTATKGRFGYDLTALEDAPDDQPLIADDAIPLPEEPPFLR